MGGFQSKASASSTSSSNPNQKLGIDSKIMLKKRNP